MKRTVRCDFRDASVALALGLAFFAAGLLGTGGPAYAQGEGTLLPEAAVPAPEAIRAALASGDAVRALDLVRREIAAHPGSPDLAVLRLLEGRILAGQGDRDGARAALAQALADSTWGAAALEQLHVIALARGEFTRAESLRTGADAKAHPALAARLAATAAWTRGEIGKAEQALGSADPLDRFSQLLSANVHIARGRLDEADVLFDRVIADSTDDVRLAALAHFGKGQSSRSRNAHAVRVLEDDAALARAELPWANLDAGWALVTLGRDDEARTRLMKAGRDVKSVQLPAKLSLARVQERAGERELAKETLAEGIRGGLGDPLAMAQLGELLARDGRAEDGRELLRAAYEALSELSIIRWRLASAGGASPGQTDALNDPAVRAVEARLGEGELTILPLFVEPDSCSVSDPRRFLRAYEHGLGEDWPAAIAWSEGASPETPGLLLVRAVALENVDRTSEALAALETLDEAGRSNWLADEHRARLLARADSAASSEVTRRLLESHPRDPRLRARIAKMRERSGDLEGAIEALRGARNAGWLTETERRRLRSTIEDLEDLQESSPKESSSSAPSGP